MVIEISFTPALSSVGRERNITRVLAALCRVTEDRSVTRTGWKGPVEFLAVDLDSQRRRHTFLCVHQVQLQLTFARLRSSLQAEYDREGVRTTTRPTVRRTGMYVGPVALRVGLAHDEEAVFTKLVVVVGCECKFAVVVVGLADLWNRDFSSFTGTGTFRLAIEGIGCSPSFRIAEDAYYEPFRHFSAVRKVFFNMRLGADKNILPVPRQPRFIPGVDPVRFQVYRTTFGPWHPDWEKQGGDVWDKQDWSAYKEPGNPTNPNAWAAIPMQPIGTAVLPTSPLSGICCCPTR